MNNNINTRQSKVFAARAYSDLQAHTEENDDALAYWLGPVNQPQHTWFDERYDDLAFEQECQREMNDIRAGR